MLSCSCFLLCFDLPYSLSNIPPWQIEECRKEQNGGTETKNRSSQLYHLSYFLTWVKVKVFKRSKSLKQDLTYSACANLQNSTCKCTNAMLCLKKRQIQIQIIYFTKYIHNNLSKNCHNLLIKSLKTSELVCSRNH